MDRIVIAHAFRFIIDTIFGDSDEENDNEDIVIASIRYKLNKMRGEKPVRILNYFEITVPALTDRQFQMHFRITRESFENLHVTIRHLICEKPNSNRVSVETQKQVLMTLWLLATPDSFRSVSERFDVSKSTLWVCFHRVVKALNRIARNVIDWPTPNERNRIARSLQRCGRIPNIVGAIDGTYVPIKAPKDNAEVYINRKCFHAITLQAIADDKLKFRNCFVGYPSSVSDIRIFRNSDIHEKMMNNTAEYFTEEEFIIGDKAYPVYKWCIPPYINRGNLGFVERNFNTAHAKTRQVIERTFALFFGRIRRMRHLDMNRADLYPMTILAACVIHNICLLREDDEIENYIEDGAAFVARNADAEEENPDVNVRIVMREGITRRDFIARQLGR